MLRLPSPGSRGYRISRWYAIILILILAFAIQFFRLGARTFHGDEFHSLSETMYLGQNINGILYFAIMNLWGRLGVSEFWSRVPSVFFAVLGAAVSYRLGRELINYRVGLLMAMMFATAPFAVEYAQLDRFYSFFLLTASLAYLALVLYLKEQSTRKLILLVAANVLVLGAHFFGVLVIASETIAFLVTTRRLSTRVKTIVFGVLAMFFLVLLASPAAQSFFYYWVARLTNAGDPTYTGARGISIANVAKIPLTYFFFGFGESVYPVDLLFVIPGILLLLVTGVWGFLAVIRRYRLGLSLLLSLALLPILLFLVFDPMSPPSLQGAAPRYVIFLLPLFYLLLASGMQGKVSSLLIVPVLMINLGSLVSYWYGDWSYSDDLVNWRTVAQWTTGYVTPETLLLVDGRAQELADHYFPSVWNRQGTWNYQSAEDLAPLAKFSRLIVLSNDFNPAPRAETSALVRLVEMEYDRTAAWSQYPLFINVFDRKKTKSESYHVDANGNVTIPTQIYGLEFQDIRLPISLDIGGRSVQSIGPFGLPGLDKKSVQTLALEPATTARTIWLLTNVVDAQQLTPGTQVATLRVIATDGLTQVVPLRVGFETSAWDSECRPEACTPAYTWRKRLALVGSESYPGSWQEFDASIFASQVNLNGSTAVRSLEIDRLPGPGNLYVWGIVLQP